MRRMAEGAGRRAVLALPLALIAAACEPPPPEPAEFVQPAVGTVYRYENVVNLILETEGIRTRFQDQQGRVAERLGLFLTTSAGSGVQVDTAALMSLWPLQAGKTAVVEIRNGEEVYEYEFAVQRTEPVETGLGTHQAFVVQAVVTPKLVRNPAAAQTLMNTWWYAPELATVARFRTTYLMGPGQGRVVSDRLVDITDRAGYEAWLRERAGPTGQGGAEGAGPGGI